MHNWLLTALLISGLCTTARAESIDTPDHPDVGIFQAGRLADGQVTATTNEPIVLAGGMTIEFWLAPDHASQSTQPAALLALATQNQDHNFIVALNAQRNALMIYVGGSSAAVRIELNDQSLHHVALIGSEGAIRVVLDGRSIGSVALSKADILDPGTFSIGSLADGQWGFDGALAAVRLWSMTLGREEVVGFADRDPRQPEQPHPALSALQLMSDLTRGELVLYNNVIQE